VVGGLEDLGLRPAPDKKQDPYMKNNLKKKELEA
jgi:hypothetical protein